MSFLFLSAWHTHTLTQTNTRAELCWGGGVREGTMSLIIGAQHSDILSCSVSADNTYSGYVSWSSRLQDVTSTPPASACASLAKSERCCGRKTECVHHCLGADSLHVRLVSYNWRRLTDMWRNLKGHSDDFPSPRDHHRHLSLFYALWAALWPLAMGQCD